MIEGKMLFDPVFQKSHVVQPQIQMQPRPPCLGFLTTGVALTTLGGAVYPRALT